MKNVKTALYCDKSQWGTGPWENEVDRLEWIDLMTGLPCLILRHKDSGHLCGYVGVHQKHPFFGKPYDDVDVKVHGGLTFSARCYGHDDDDVCHDSLEEAWWFGFDCAHCFDFRPSTTKYRAQEPREVYRDISFVQHQCKSLARQLSAKIKR